MLLTTFLLTELGIIIYDKVKETAKEAVPVALAEMGTKTIFKKAGEQIKKFYGGKNLQENGDLLKAIRIAMLDATLLVADEAFTEMKKEDAAERPYTVGDKVVIQQKQFNKWIADEKKLAGKKATEEIISSVAYSQIEMLINNSKNDNVIKLRADLAQSCKNEFLTELKEAFTKDFPPLIEEYLLNGWGKDKDWFDCTCFQFGQLLKQGEFEKSKIAFENDLLSKIAVDGGVLNIKFDTAIKLLEHAVSYGEYILEKLKQLDRIEDKIDKGFEGIKETTDKILEHIIGSSSSFQELQKEVNERTQKRNELNEQIDRLKERIVINHNDEIDKTSLKTISDLFNANIIELERAKNKLEEKTKATATQISYFLNLNTETASKRLKKIRDLIFDGKGEEALAILNSPEREEEKRQLLKTKEATENHCIEVSKEELIHALEVLKNINNDNRIQDAIHYFEESLLYHTFFDNLYHFGRFYLDIGHVNHALPYYEKALSLLDIEANNENDEYAIILNDLGSIYNAKGNLDKAIEYHEKVLKLFGEENPAVANQYNNLGLAWLNKGNFDKAIEYFERALKINLKLFGEQNLAVAIQYNNLGKASHDKGDLYMAIGYNEKALKIDLELFGEENQKIATDYNNLGESYRMKGDLGKAIENFERALKIDLKLFGEENQKIATYYNNLGLAWANKRDLDKAIGYFEKALKIDLKLFGEENPNTVGDYNSLGGVWAYKGDFDKAFKFGEKAYSIIFKLYGAENPRTKLYKKNLDAYKRKKEGW